MNSSVYRKIFSVTLILLLLCCSAGCTGSGTTENTTPQTGPLKTITVTDCVGRTVEVPDNPQRIAVGGSGGCMRYFTYFNAIDRVVAVDHMDNGTFYQEDEGRPYYIAHPEIGTRPMLGGSRGAIETENLMLANPDVLFYAGQSSVDAQTADTITKKTGIPVVCIFMGDYATEKDQIYASMRTIAKILHTEPRTEEIISYFDAVEDDLRKRVESVESTGKTVYIGGISGSGSNGMEGTCVTYLPFMILKLTNVAKDVPTTGATGFIRLAKEKILEWDPDIIFIDVATRINPPNNGAIGEILTDPSYKELKAVKTGDVYLLNPYAIMGSNHETTLANTYYIGKLLYPDQFADIDIKEKADEIYTFVVGKPVFDQLKENMNGFSYMKLDV